MSLKETVYQSSDYPSQEMEAAEHFDLYPYDPADGLFGETLQRMEKDKKWLTQACWTWQGLAYRYFGDELSRMDEAVEYIHLVKACFGTLAARGILRASTGCWFIRGVRERLAELKAQNRPHRKVTPPLFISPEVLGTTYNPHFMDGCGYSVTRNLTKQRGEVK